MNSLAGKKILVGVTGSIAAYKAVEVVRRLLLEGAAVSVILTASAKRFVGAVTFSGLTGQRIYEDMWDATFPGELHVALADGADALVIVPATADILSRLATGRADDLLAALALVVACPTIVAPAMHPRMWAHAATASNVAALKSRGVIFAGPVDGLVASGERGIGRLSEPVDVVSVVTAALFERNDLAGKRVVVSAGPTFEAIDPVRFLGNRSSGTMGFAIARAAARRGAQVTLIAGPVALETPAGVKRIDVESAVEMRNAVFHATGPQVELAELVVMAAAVADFRVANPSVAKLKKVPNEPSRTLTLVQNPDILAELGAARSPTSATKLVGFALETGADDEIVRYAKDKLDRKRADLIVGNSAAESLGRADNRVVLVSHENAVWQPTRDKAALADLILDHARAIERPAMG